MVKFTQEEMNLRNSHLPKPLTAKGRFLKEKRMAQQMKNAMKLPTIRSRTRNFTMKSVKPAMKTAKSLKVGRSSRSRKTRKLHRILQPTKSHLKQAKHMIRFLNAFLMKYNTLEDQSELQKYTNFAVLLSGGLYDVLQDTIGTYTDPIDYLENCKEYLETNKYEIDPDVIAKLYNEFLEEQQTLLQAKSQTVNMVTNNTTMDALFVKDELQNEQEESVGDDLLSMFGTMKV